MEKFPILCMVSALLVFLSATVGAAGVQTVKKNDLPFGMNSVERVQRDVRQIGMSAVQIDPSFSAQTSRRQGMNLARGETPVEISGDLLVSF